MSRSLAACVAAFIIGAFAAPSPESLAAADTESCSADDSCALSVLQSRAEQRGRAELGAAANASKASCNVPACKGADCCPTSARDCIEHAERVKQIYLYSLEMGTGRACIDHIKKKTGVVLDISDLCVGSGLVSNIQAFVAPKAGPLQDPGNCRNHMYGPTSVAPQLGCNQWAWFSSADAILIFLKAVYEQKTFTTGADFVMELEAKAGASPSPDATDARPITWAKATMFNRLNPFTPRLTHPGGPALVDGPGVAPTFKGFHTFMADRTKKPLPPSFEDRGNLNWWVGSKFKVTDCPKAPGVFTDVCKDAHKVLSGLSVMAIQSMLTENFRQITGCPWTRGAQPAPGNTETHGYDYFDVELSTGTYSCTGGFGNVATCMACPAGSTCLAPNADLVGNGFTGCGQAAASQCYPVTWFGNLKKGRTFPTEGCTEEWVADMRSWLANPRQHLTDLAKQKNGATTAIQAVNTMMFVFDNLATSGKSGWNYFGGFPHTTADGEPTCSTLGAWGEKDKVPASLRCGGANLPCCDPAAEKDTDFSVSFASSGSPNVEWVTKNLVPDEKGQCVTTVHVCGPPGDVDTPLLKGKTAFQCH